MGRNDDLIRQLNKFVKLISREYPIKKMILFGSQATGKARENSDVDLIVISKAFQHRRRIKRSPPLYLKWNLKYPVDFLCYTPEEFEKKKKQLGIVQQAVKEGIEII